MLAEITRRELQRMNEEEEEKRVAQESLNPPEYVKKLIYKLVIENRPLSQKEMDYVKMHIEKPNIRSQFSDFLMAFTSPRSIRDEKCLEMLGDIIKVVIDLLIEEKDNSNMKELISIMHCSQLLFTFKEDGGAGGRMTKVFLNSYISEHEIWQDVEVWRLCLQRLINLKFHDAVKQ